MKILVQTQVTVTLEMNGTEAQNLTDLLHLGISLNTLKKLGLDELADNLVKKFPPSKEILFEKLAVIK